MEIKSNDKTLKNLRKNTAFLLKNDFVLVVLVILIIGFQLGLQHVKIGWIFNSSSIKIPLHLIGGEVKALKLAWMYMSLPVGIFLLISVNIELILKKIIIICDHNIKIPNDIDKENLGA